jgi:integrase/recombinase XerC
MNPIENLIQQFLDYKFNIENGSSKTYIAYKQDLQSQFSPYMTSRGNTLIEELSRTDVESFLVTIRQRSESGSVANMNRKLATIKSFLSYLEERGISFDKGIKNIKSAKNHTKTISYLTENELHHLIHTVETTATPYYLRRDLAILILFLSTGIRVSELLNLKIGDIEFHSKNLNFINIIRKGGNHDRLPINEKAVTSLKSYIVKRAPATPASHLFVSRTNTQLDANSIYYLVKHYLHRANIKKQKQGPHILRHTVGVSLRRKGVDLVTIQRLLGHKKLETTGIYLHVEAQDLVKAVELL